MPKKGRARRFREARELKQGYDDGLFKEDSGTLADSPAVDDDFDDEWDDEDDKSGWDDEDPLKADDR